MPSSDPSVVDLSLPEPTLGSIDAIVAAIDDPAQAGNVVVSMLAQLGIGLYRADGTAIRKGTETSDADFFVFEPAAQGLVAMLSQRADPTDQTSFRDYHQGLLGSGYTGSAEELAAAFASAYAAEPDAAVSRLVNALGPIDVEGNLSDFELWLITVDGFVPPNRSTTAIAMAGDGLLPVAAAGSAWGVARRNISPAASVSNWVDVANELRAICASWQVTVTAAPASVHEGHNGAKGDATTFTATLSGPRAALTSPFGGGSIVPAATGAAGMDMEWVAGATATSHGSVDSPVTTVGAGGSATTTYTPKVEDADGKGIDREERGALYAGVWRRDLMLQLYGQFVAPYVTFFTGHLYGNGFIDIGWHEKAEAVVKIVWTDFYNDVEDRITVLGSLTHDDGGGLYSGTGTATGSRAGWAGCNPGIDSVPSGTVNATFNGFTAGDGTITISAYADVMTQLSGISTAPMTVPIEGGHAVFTSSETGDLCPHASDGEMFVTGLTLP
ncbi:MAG TPA: hypothetical protein VFI15_10190 [Candidatus Limnocylindrales bacterium]|nr:hypothetical protein [Candidatus Limnocylindrales bacterium]